MSKVHLTKAEKAFLGATFVEFAHFGDDAHLTHHPKAERTENEVMAARAERAG